jgi:hypothetical protein
MATKIKLYNEALILLGSRTLAALTDVRAERRTLDSVYDSTIEYMLDSGIWNFALRPIELDESDDVESLFGWQYVFEKPEDYVRLSKISDNETLAPTLEDFGEEGDYLLANCKPLYLQYVSDDVAYGRDLGKWTPSFETAFIDELAFRASPQIQHVPLQTRDWLAKKKKISLSTARSRDSVNQPISHLPTGRLVRARMGSRWTNQSRRSYE